MRFGWAPLSVLMAAAAISGCGLSRSVEVTADQTCVELNKAIAETAEGISAAARSRGRVEAFEVPSWLSPAENIRQSRVDRYTREIEDLRAVQQRAKTEVIRRCSRHGD